MEKLGTVVEILNPKAVLIQSGHDLSVNRILTVFSRVHSKQLSEKYQLDFLDFPKGEVVISSKQGEFYVASVYQPTVERKRAVESPGVLSALLRQELITEEVPGTPSASLGRPTMEIRVTDRVEVGDYVGDN
jgi:hypothetical protein